MEGKKLQIRTNDRLLARALECWWCDYQRSAPDGKWVISDIDTVSPLHLPCEITVSASAAADICRPFSFAELEKQFESGTPEEKFSEKRLIFREKKAYLDGTLLHLSPLEYKLLYLLSETAGPIGSDEISRRLWGEPRSSNQINVYISYIRKKTELSGRPRLIFTAKGKGFYIKNDERTIRTAAECAADESGGEKK